MAEEEGFGGTSSSSFSSSAGQGDGGEASSSLSSSPVEVVLVLEGGRVGAELGNMALLELGSALAAVTSPPHDSAADAAAAKDDDDDGDNDDNDDDVPTETDRVVHGGKSKRRSSSPPPPPFVPRWIDDLVPLASASSSHPTTVIASVPFPSLAAVRAAVNRCALTRMALVPMTDTHGDPTTVARALGPSLAGKCAAQVLAPGRKGTPRVALERVGAELWDAGVGKEVAADRAWLEARSVGLHAHTTTTSVMENGNRDVNPPEVEVVEAQRRKEEEDDDVTAAVYLHPEGLLCHVAAWGRTATLPTRRRCVDGATHCARAAGYSRRPHRLRSRRHETRRRRRTA